jgi:putative glutamine amidotransferase
MPTAAATPSQKTAVLRRCDRTTCRGYRTTLVPVSELRPLIAVTAGNRPDRSAAPRLAVNGAYVSALQAAGADVVLLPPVPPGQPPVAPALLDRLDGVLLPGGADVNPERYGEAPRRGLGDVDDGLDSLELALVQAALDRELPVFGICRGHQVVNVAMGGSLYQDLARDGVTSLRHATDLTLGRDRLAHAIEVRPGTRLRELLGADRLEVNSHHHQAVRRVAPGLVVSAVSIADGVIEGLESGDGRIVTVQCHPEELTHLAWARALFRGLVAAASGALPVR